MVKEVITTHKIPKPTNPFSVGIKAKGFLFTAGQVGKDEDGMIAEGFMQQVRHAMENLKTVIEAGGSSMDDVVKVTVFLTDISRMADFNKIYQSYFSDSFPARSTFEVSRLGLKAEVEVEAIAVCND